MAPSPVGEVMRPVLFPVVRIELTTMQSAESVPHLPRPSGTFLRNFKNATGWPLDDTTSSQPQPQVRRTFGSALRSWLLFRLGLWRHTTGGDPSEQCRGACPEAFAPAFFRAVPDGLRARDGGTAADLQVDLIKLRQRQSRNGGEERPRKKLRRLNVLRKRSKQRRHPCLPRISAIGHANSTRARSDCPARSASGSPTRIGWPALLLIQHLCQRNRSLNQL